MPIDTPLFLMSPPRRDWSLQGRANFRSREADDVDATRARSEWSDLADAIVEAGGDVLVCPPNPRRNLTGMIYTAEAGEFYRNEKGRPRYLLPNMAAEHRRLEADWIGGFIEGLGIRTETVESRWEAQGDAIRGRSGREVVHTWGEGPDGRTARDAYEAVAGKLGDRELHLKFEAAPWFHGNTFMNVYRAPRADQTPSALLLVCPEALPEGEFERLTAFLREDGPEEDLLVETIGREASLGYDTNALQVRESVLAPSTLSASTEAAMSELGLQIVKLDLGELFKKGGGAPVCLTNRLWGLSPEDVPGRHLWSFNPSLSAHNEVS